MIKNKKVTRIYANSIGRWFPDFLIASNSAIVGFFKNYQKNNAVKRYISNKMLQVF